MKLSFIFASSILFFACVSQRTPTVLPSCESVVQKFSPVEYVKGLPDAGVLLAKTDGKYAQFVVIASPKLSVDIEKQLEKKGAVRIDQSKCEHTLSGFVYGVLSMEMMSDEGSGT